MMPPTVKYRACAGAIVLMTPIDGDNILTSALLDIFRRRGRVNLEINGIEIPCAVTLAETPLRLDLASFTWRITPVEDAVGKS